LLPHAFGSCDWKTFWRLSPFEMIDLVQKNPPWAGFLLFGDLDKCFPRICLISEGDAGLTLLQRYPGLSSLILVREDIAV